MAVDSHHPQYDEFAPYWVKLRDTYAGSDKVKSRRLTYLPATSGMIQDGMQSTTDRGYKAYQSYLLRAVFHDYVADAVKIAIGAMYCKPPTIELPEQMEPLRNAATANGETLDMLLRRINEQQLVTGRLVLLMDNPSVPDPSRPLPYFVIYNAETLINWDDGDRDASNMPRLNLAVFCETSLERQSDFSWQNVEKYRVLILGAPAENEAPGVPAVARMALVERGSVKDATEETVELKTLMYKGRTLTELPCRIINARDVVSDPDYPPLNGLADIALASYRGEADYRQNLFMQAQDTLVTVGSSEDDHRVGAGAAINLKHGGEAYYIGVSADGLSEMAKALSADKAEAAHRAGQLIDNRARPFESGEALKVRQSGQSATLTEIAIAGAFGLETMLKQMARWIGADETKVVVKPNLDFSLTGMISQELVELMSARAMGAPISLKTIHTLMEERGLTRLSLEDELKEMAKDPPIQMGTDAGGDADAPKTPGQAGNDSTGA